MNINFMEEALKEAQKAMKHNEVPVGAIITHNNKIISRGYNKKEKEKTSINHAEIIAIKKACKKLKTWHLDDCELYVTMEPCIMCYGAIEESRIKKIYYCVENKKTGFKSRIKNASVTYENKILEKESLKLLKMFFKDKRF